ncbi:IclR family transcriptional regulator [Ammoniphilus sp. YIM 78166]|uniref:IclR family transcriptional regulator n=1 Tax=Ammoniphilus sp. YIM 78166 TaxID=1644106 RepID=UPI00107001EA|nr:IclR family transcriptional regulator [Ammoniphilus sp. YIM 78166]
MESTRSKDAESLRTVQRALDILDCFTTQEPELSLTDISNKIQLAKSTTTRLLATLEQNEYLIKNSDTLRYRLGTKLFFLGHIVGESMEIRNIARPYMTKLRDLTKETVNLYVLEDRSRICVEQCEGLHTIRHMVNLGEKLPLHVGAGAKVLLAYQSHGIQEEVLAEVPAGRRNQLREELQEIRNVGVAYSQGEREVGSSAVAAPIFDIKGRVTACLSISGPTSRFPEETVSFLKVIVKAEALQISKDIGFAVDR